MFKQKFVSKKSNGNQIKVSTILTIGVVLVALVLSILAMIFANDNKVTTDKGSDIPTQTPYTPYTPFPKGEYVTQEQLNDNLMDYTKNTDFNDNCDDWAKEAQVVFKDDLNNLSKTVSSLKDTVEKKCVFYDDALNIQSQKQTKGGGGYLSDQQPNAMFQGTAQGWETMYMRRAKS